MARTQVKIADGIGFLSAQTPTPDSAPILYAVGSSSAPAVIPASSILNYTISPLAGQPGYSIVTWPGTAYQKVISNDQVATFKAGLTAATVNAVNTKLQTYILQEQTAAANPAPQPTPVPAPPPAEPVNNPSPTATNSATDLNAISTPPKTSITSSSSTDLNAISSPPTLTVTSVNQAAANGTASLNVIATAPGAPTPSTPSAISAIISDEPIAGPDVSALIANDPLFTTEIELTPPVISIAADQDATQFSARSDWRVRLALTEDTGANYMYRAPNPGILAPLAATKGVIFPYTPTVAVNYAANYDQTPLVHSNYTVYQYSRSSVDSVQITGDFTAQDTHEANYLLAVIHFFRSMTKMFYGQDENPKRGTPPPLCYLFGLGTFQFSAHPLAIAGFSYNLPNDVDYIKTVSPYSPGAQQPSNNTGAAPSRLPPGVTPGGKAAQPNFAGPSNNQTGDVTWVPTKIQLTISCLPMQSRNQVSNKFSLEQYASGDLLNGIKNPGGAFW